MSAPTPKIPERPDPLAPSVEFEPTSMQVAAHDPAFRRRHPGVAAVNAYKYNSNDSTLGGWAGNMLRGITSNPMVRGAGNFISKGFNHGPLMGAGAGAGLGYAGGALITKIMQLLGNTNAPDLALPMAALGTAAGGYAGHTRQEAVKLGAAIATLHFGYSPGEFERLSHIESEIDNASSPAGNGETARGEMSKMACRIAAHAFAELGEKHELTFHYFNEMSKSARWNTEFQPYADAVVVALARMNASATDRHYAEQEENIKHGAAIGSTAARILGTTASNTPQIATALLGLAAAGGAGAGALTWLAGKHAREDSNDVEEIKQKLNYYRSLTREIKEELRAKKISPPELVS